MSKIVKQVLRKRDRSADAGVRHSEAARPMPLPWPLRKHGQRTEGMASGQFRRQRAEGKAAAHAAGEQQAGDGRGASANTRGSAGAACRKPARTGALVGSAGHRMARCTQRARSRRPWRCGSLERLLLRASSPGGGLRRHRDRRADGRADALRAADRARIRRARPARADRGKTPCIDIL